MGMQAIGPGAWLSDGDLEQAASQQVHHKPGQSGERDEPAQALPAGRLPNPLIVVAKERPDVLGQRIATPRVEQRDALDYDEPQRPEDPKRSGPVHLGSSAFFLAAAVGNPARNAPAMNKPISLPT